jgi:hypothetical protein
MIPDDKDAIRRRLRAHLEQASRERMPKLMRAVEALFPEYDPHTGLALLTLSCAMGKMSFDNHAPVSRAGWLVLCELVWDELEVEKAEASS